MKIVEINAPGELTVPDELIEKFTSRGWQIYGEGRDQIVLGKPNTRYVLKIVGQGSGTRIDQVRDIIAFYRQHQNNPYFPRVGGDRTFNLDGKQYYAYTQEMLKHLPGDEAVLDYLETTMDRLGRGQEPDFAKIPKGLTAQDVDGLAAAVDALFAGGGDANLFDLANVYNIMQRDNGHLVIVDPFAGWDEDEILDEAVTFNYGIGKNPGKLVKVRPNGRVPHAKMHVNVPKKTAVKLGIPHTHLKESITESSALTYEGSWTPDLVFSKLWIAHELEKILGDKTIPVVYILGSWYGNLSVILARSNLNIDKIINVDTNKDWLQAGQQVIQQMNIKNVEHMNKDSNTLDYRQLPGIVINTSTNDIKNEGWFDNIPDGTLVVLQGRDRVDPQADYNFDGPQDLLEQYPLNKVLYQSAITLTDPETEYTRSMVIGIK